MPAAKHPACQPRLLVKRRPLSMLAFVLVNYKEGKLKKRVIIVDIVAILGIFVLLSASVLLDFQEYLFKLPFITLLVFYAIGKYARDYELKLWDRKNTKITPKLESKNDA